MSIESARDLEQLKQVGRIVALILSQLREEVRAGVTTAELDRLCAELLARHDARSGPMLQYGFPGAMCISVNDEAVHGVPRQRVLLPGDLVKLDLVAERGGYFADAAVSVAVPPATRDAKQLIKCARRALDRALDCARANRGTSDVGRTIEREVRRDRFRVIPRLAGHGVGRAVHEPPVVPNFADRNEDSVLTEGLVIAVEPIITSGCGDVVDGDDGWTIRTSDAAMVAHWEHTIVVTRDLPIVVTAL